MWRSGFSQLHQMVEVRNASMPGLLLGVGTIRICNGKRLHALVQISCEPGFVKEVADYAGSNDLFYAPLHDPIGDHSCRKRRREVH